MKVDSTPPPPTPIPALTPVPDDAVVQVIVIVSALPVDRYHHAIAALPSQVSAGRTHFHAKIGEALRATHGDLDRLTAHARSHGLHATRRELPGQVIVTGLAGAIRAAFTPFVGSGEVAPAPPFALDGAVIALAGLDAAPVALPHVFAYGVPQAGAPLFTAPELARRYAFPPTCDGAGQKVGVVLQGGGFVPDDPGLHRYFTCLGLPVPQMSVVTVGGAANDPMPAMEIALLLTNSGAGEIGPPAACETGRSWPVTAKAGRASKDDLSDRLNWTAEGLMDVELLGAVAPGVAITVYVAPAAPTCLAQAILAAVDDGMSVISCSFGTAEATYSAADREAIERAFLVAVAHDVTVCFSSGNNGSTSDSVGLSVQYPASSPWVLTCGGTQFRAPAGADLTEQVWNEVAFGTKGASGGGFSAVFAQPPWQEGVTRPPGTMRGVPDVASVASFNSGCWIWYGDAREGINTASAGTSASAPVWAGLIARLNQAVGHRLGLVTPRLYGSRVRASFEEILVGDNIISANVTAYDAQPIWSACTGLGRPVGTGLLEALRAR